MKSFLVTLLTWGVAFVPLWYWAHETFYPPGDWVGAAIVSFFIALAIGGLRKARLERGDAALVARPEGPPKDGERVAIAGTIEPTGEALKAPLSGKPCVIYDYEISHIRELSPLLGQSKNQTSRPSESIDRSGMAIAPSVIRSNLREVKVLAFPGIEGFPSNKFNDDKTIDRARAYIAATPFEEQSVFDAPAQITKLLEDRSGSLRVDWKSSDYDKLENSRFTERLVPPGAKACLVGLYSAKENGIVPQANTGGVRLVSGSREEALEFLRDKGTGSIIGAVLFLLVPAPITYGILTHREHYFEENNQPSVKSERLDAYWVAVNTGDIAAVRRALDHGVDANEHESRGYSATMLAAGYGHADLVRLLIAHHADLAEKHSESQKTALDLATSNGHEDVAKILREAGAR